MVRLGVCERGSKDASIYLPGQEIRKLKERNLTDRVILLLYGSPRS